MPASVFLQPVSSSSPVRRLWAFTRQSGRVLTALLGSVALLASSAPLRANPVGEQIMVGQALIERSPDGSILTVTQGSDRAVINWGGFSIGAGETTQFLQPGPTSATLNRVLNGLSSQIDGNLLANGRIYLINPNGIMVGPTGRIDVNSFIGSTLDVSDEAFMAGGDMTFSGASQASVINYGTINAIGGDIFLIGRQVENHGLLNAPQGTVGLGAGQEVLLRAAGEERLFVQPSGASGEGEGEGGGGTGTGVTNTGTIQAASAELKAHGNMYALAINNGGVIRATGVNKQGGRVILSAPGGTIQSTGQIEAKDGAGGGGVVKIDGGVGGTVNVSGKIDAIGDDGTGGEIQVTAGTVNIQAGAELLASGLTGGGSILVGGDLQGANPEVQNAINTFVDYGAILRADSLGSGDAGRIIIWADGTTQYFGELSARAYGSTGDGGFAEVSGKEHLWFDGKVDLRSAQGKTGSLLLDPGTVYIIDDQDQEPPESDFFTDAQIAALLASANVTIQTSDASGINGSTETINIFSGVNIGWNSANSLTLNAGENIFVNDGVIISNQGTGGIFMVANEAQVTTSSYDGIYLGTDVILSTKGSINLKGHGAFTGIYIASSPYGATAQISSDTGIITLEGTGSMYGVYSNEGLAFAKTGGAVNLFGNTYLGQISTSGTNWDLNFAGAGDILSNNFEHTGGLRFITSGINEFRVYGGIDFTQTTYLAGNLNSHGSSATLSNVVLEAASSIITYGGDLTMGKTLANGFGLELNTEFVETAMGGPEELIAGNIYLENAENELADLTIVGDLVSIANSQEITQNNAWIIKELYLSNFGGDITLDNANNLIGDIYLESAAGNIVIRENDIISQGGAWTATSVDLNAANGSQDIYLDFDSEGEGDYNQIGTATFRANSLYFTNDAIIQDGANPWVIAEEMWLNSRGNDILLKNTNNQFGSIALVTDDQNPIANLEINASSDIYQWNMWFADNTVIKAHDDHDVYLTAGNEVEPFGSRFGDLTIWARNLSLYEDDNITDGDAWNITGYTGLSTNGQNIILNNPGNVLGDIEISGVNDVEIHETGDITQANPWDVNNVILRATGGVYLDAFDISEGEWFNSFGDLEIWGTSLSLIEDGLVTDGGAWNVTGPVTIDSRGNTITLNNSGNVLGDVTITGTVPSLTIYEDDEITQGNAWSAPQLYLASNGKNITLDQTANSFGTIYLDSPAGDFLLRQTGNITQGNSWTASLVDADAGNGMGNIYLDLGANAINAFTLRGSEAYIGNTVDITDAAAWTITGPVALDAQGNNIVLDESGNQLGDISIFGYTPNVTIHENDDVTQGSTWNTGITRIESTGNIFLDYSEFDSELFETTYNTLGDLTLRGGNVRVIEEGNITDGDFWDVNLVYLNAQDNAVILNNPANILGAIDLESVGNATIYEADDITQISPWQVGDLTLLSTGKIFLNAIDEGEGTNYNQIDDITVLGATEFYLVEEGTITDEGSWQVSGLVSLDSRGNNIVLDHMDNALGAIAITGQIPNLTIRENDAIEQSGPWTAGPTFLDSRGNDIILENEGNVLGAITLGSPAATLSITEDDAITQGGTPWESTGPATFIALNQKAITLNNPGNKFGLLSVTGGAVSIYEDDAIVGGPTAWATQGLTLSSNGNAIELTNAGNVLGAISIVGPVSSLDLVEDDDIDQNGAWSVGTATFNSGAEHSVNLTELGNNIGPMQITAGAGATVVNNANINQSGAWEIGGPLTLNAQGNDIILNDADNSFGPISMTGPADEVVIFADGDVTQGSVWNTGATIIQANGAIDLGYYEGETFNVLGNLTLTSLTNSNIWVVEEDDITQGGAWTGGATTLWAVDHDVILEQPSNVLGDIELVANTVSLRETGDITQSNLWFTGNTTLFATGGIFLNAFYFVSEGQFEQYEYSQMGDLTLTALTAEVFESDDITDGGRWNISGPVLLNSYGNAIVLDNADNQMGAISLQGSASSLTIIENDSITQGSAWTAGATLLDAQGNDIILDQAGNVLGLITLGSATNDLTIIENDAIQQGASPWTVTGETILDAGSFAITLANPTNQFKNLTVTGGDVTIYENDAIVGVNQWTTGNLTLSSNGNAIDLTNTGNVLGAIAIVGPVSSLDLVENDDIDQNGAWSVGMATLDAGADHRVNLTELGNNIGPMQITAGAGATVVNNANINQSGAWEIGGPVTLNAQGNDIILNDQDNTLGAISMAGPADEVVIFEDGDVTQGSVWNTGATTIQAAGNIYLDWIEFGEPDLYNVFGALSLTSTTGGDLFVTEGDHITQAGAWTGGYTNLWAVNHDVILDEPANSLGDIALMANLVSLTETGDITQASPWFTGNTALTATGGIFLNATSEGNSVMGGLTLTGTSAHIIESDAITDDGAWTISGPVRLDSGGNAIILDNAGNQMGAVAIDGTASSLTIRENGDITQGSAWNAGATLLDAQGNDIILDQEGNVLGAISLGAFTGDLTLVEASAITQGASAWNVTGETILNAGDNAIILGNAGNRFANLTVTGGNVTLYENDVITGFGQWQTGDLTLSSAGNSIALINEGNVVGEITLLGNVGDLHLVENDDIVQKAGTPWTVASATFDAGENELRLTESGNAIGPMLIYAGSATITNSLNVTQGSAWFVPGNITFNVNGADIILGQDNNVLGDIAIIGSAGNLLLRENDAITQNGPWQTGQTTLHTNGQEVLLAALGNQLGDLWVNTLGDEVAGEEVFGDVTIAENGPITQFQSWITGNTTLTTGNNVILTLEGNVLGDLKLEVGGDVDLLEADDITQFDAWDVQGFTRLQSNGNIFLSDPGNQLGRVGVQAFNVALRQTNSIELDSSLVAGVLELWAAGNITQSAPIAVNTLIARADEGDIILNHLGNKILFLGDIAAYGDIDIFEDPGLVIGGLVYSTTGNVAIGSYGAGLSLGQGGAVVAAGEGANIVLYTDQLFVNNSLSTTPLTTGAGGQWFIYAGGPGSVLGVLEPDFTEFEAFYPQIPTGNGNGLLLASTAPPEPPPVRPLFPTPPGFFTPDPGGQGLLPGQTGPLVSQNPINDFSNFDNNLFAQAENAQFSQQGDEIYEGEEGEGEGNNNNSTSGNQGGTPQVNDVDPDDGVTEFGPGGTSGIPDGNAPPDLFEGLGNNAQDELNEALQ